MRQKAIIVALAAALALALAATAWSDVIPTPYAKRFKGEVFYNGRLAPLGTIIDAYDPDGVNCGRDTVANYLDSAGVYGTMHVYGDDMQYTPTIDEGAEPLDLITFKVNGRLAQATVISGDLLWRDQDNATVDLSVSDAIIAMDLVEAPADKLGAPGQTLRFWVSVENIGNGLDLYGVKVTSKRGWTTVAPNYVTYAGVGEVAYLWFDVELPTWPGTDRTDTLTYEVYSHLDTTVSVGGTVRATAEAGTTYALTITSAPLDRYANAGSVVRFDVKVRNIGTVADVYQILAVSSQGFTVNLMPSFVAANPGQEVGLWFQVVVPSWADEIDADLIDYSILSTSDPAVFASGSVLLTPQQPTDVANGDVTLLPDRIALAQNYPNPFNPTTTISFTLPARSTVSINIFDILGRTVENVDLGSLGAGEHEIVYDASALASGVYFYRLNTEMGMQTRKMVLMK